MECLISGVRRQAIHTQKIDNATLKIISYIYMRLKYNSLASKFVELQKKNQLKVKKA